MELDAAITELIREQFTHSLIGLRRRLDDSNRRKELASKELQELRKKKEVLDARNKYFKKTLYDLMDFEADAKNGQQKASVDEEKSSEKIGNADLVKPFKFGAEKRIHEEGSDVGIHKKKVARRAQTSEQYASKKIVRNKIDVNIGGEPKLNLCMALFTDKSHCEKRPMSKNTVEFESTAVLSKASTVQSMDVETIHNQGGVLIETRQPQKPDEENELKTNIDSNEAEEGQNIESEHNEGDACFLVPNKSTFNISNFLKQHHLSENRPCTSLPRAVLSSIPGETTPIHPRGVFFGVPAGISLHEVQKYIRDGPLERIFLQDNMSCKNLQDCMVVFQTSTARESLLMFSEINGGIRFGYKLYPFVPLRWKERIHKPYVTEAFRLMRTRVLVIYDYPDRITNNQVAKDLQYDRNGRLVRVAGAEKIHVYIYNDVRDVVITCDTVDRAAENLRHMVNNARIVYSHLRIEYGKDKRDGGVDTLLRI
ncbi:hypothetical protein RUND412_006405 [Rhizina undulata]